MPNNYRHPNLLHLSNKQRAANAGKAALIVGGKAQPPKPRKPRARGYKVNRAEDKIRTDIIKALRKHHIFVRRLEPAFRGSFGVADLLVINKSRLLFRFLEVKAPAGVLSDEQREFRDLCNLCCVNYCVVKSVDEALEQAGVI